MHWGVADAAKFFGHTLNDVARSRRRSGLHSGGSHAWRRSVHVAGCRGDWAQTDGGGVQGSSL